MIKTASEALKNSRASRESIRSPWAKSRADEPGIEQHPTLV